MQFPINPYKATLSIPMEVVLFVFKDARQLRGEGHQKFDFDLCTKWKRK